MVPSMYRMNPCPTLIPAEYCFTWKDEILWMSFYVCKRTKRQWQCTASWSLLENQLWKGLVSSWRFIPPSLSSRSHPWPHILCVFVYLSQIVRMHLPWWYVPLQNRRTCYSVSSWRPRTPSNLPGSKLYVDKWPTRFAELMRWVNTHARTHIYRNMATSSSDHPPQAWNRTQLFILLALLFFYCGYKLGGLCGPFGVG